MVIPAATPVLRDAAGTVASIDAVLFVRRDNQRESAYCLTIECSRTIPPLPHDNVPHAGSGINSPWFDWRLELHRTEHHRVSLFPPPNLQATLQRAQKVIGISPRLLRL